MDRPAKASGAFDDRDTLAKGLRVTVRDWNVLTAARPAEARRALRDLRVEAGTVARTPHRLWRFRIEGG